MTKHVKYNAWVETKREAGVVEIEMPDGTVFSIDPPEIWSDAQQDAARSGTNKGLAQALLGDRYDEFVEKGGSANGFVYLLTEQHGLSLGE